MSQVINTNVMSLNAQRNLSTSGGQLAQSLQRLSSGLRINSAKDDAAGLAISQRFTTQIQGLNQAVRNANDGISLAQTGEGALQEVSNNLQRIRELAVQAANATNSDSDRAALNQEVQQRLAEIDRIASQTSFNGLRILDGSFGNAAFQVGANVGQTITVELEASTRLADIGAVSSVTATDTADAFVGGSEAEVVLTLGGLTFDADPLAFTVDGNSIVLDADYATGAALEAVVTGVLGADYTVEYDTGALTITRAAVGENPISVTGAVIASSDAGEDPSLDLATGQFTIQVGEGAVRNVVGQFSSVEELAAAINTDVAGVYASVQDGELVLQGSESFTVGGAAAAGIGLAGEVAVSGDLTEVNILDVAGANDAILRMDAALESVSSLRGVFGAIQNRFESTIANLSATSENLSASRSRIMDTDFAAETAALTRAQVLQQAGVAMLAQANAAPQSVLALLR